MTQQLTNELRGTYRPRSGHFDEFVDGGDVRTHWAGVATALDRMGPAELAERTRESARLLANDAVTYNVTTGDVSSPRLWLLDPVPVVISAEEWAGVEAGLAQRAELLDLVLSDLYGSRRLVADGLIPPELVYSHPEFLRECDGVRLPGDHQLFHAAFDLGRDADGTLTVISNRTQAPSGMGYALENRVVASRVLPEIYRDNSVVRLAPFFRELRAALQRVAPPGTENPRIVVLTPGPWSETAYEHAALASYLGYPLVQGSDLRVRDGRVWVRTVGRLEPVHVILRRVDASYCDPLELRPDSHLGVPGLLEACRVGNVSVVNTFGSGVLENPGMNAFLPRIAEELLGEELRIPGVRTWWCGETDSLRYVLDHLHELVLKTPLDTDLTPVLGFESSDAQLADLRNRILARPYAWVGQEQLALGVVPTFVGGGLEPRRSVVRGFAVAAENGYAVMPGALTRIGPTPEEGLISNQNGAWSKDTWVLSREPERSTGYWLQPDDSLVRIEPVTSMSQRAAENLFWLSRYAERAEDAVRQVRVASDRLTEFASGTSVAGSTCISVLLNALTYTTGTFPGFVGLDSPAKLAEPGPELRSLLVDPDRVGSVAHSVRHLLEAAAQVRDQLSNDTWLVIGHLESDLAELDENLPVVAVTGVFGRVLAAMLALSGLSAESMVRDDGWQFMEAGRRIERSLQLCSLLAATITARRDPATDSLVIESVLTAAESIVTYRRRYRSRAQVETLLDLLVLDADNPRSLAYQIDHLAEAVRAMPAPEGGDEVEIEALLDELATVVALADTNELARFDDELTEIDRPQPLWAFLVNITELLTRLGDRLDTAHFSHQLPQRIVAPSQNYGPVVRRPGDGPDVTYRVVHRTQYAYDAAVSASFGVAHLHPRETARQQTYSSTVTIDPFPEHYRERRDFFGNRATHFTVLEPHRELIVTATSLVDVLDGPDVAETLGDLPWEQARDRLHADDEAETLEARQFVLESPTAAISAAATGYASPSFAPGRPLFEALSELSHRMNGDFEFSPGATTVSTPVEEFLERRAGVCQDFAHLTISALRGMGLAVRYVSGYLETVPPPGHARLVGADVSHAWVSVYVPSVGWIDLDPTNDQFVNHRYVTVAWGRDYADVPPLKGVIFTQGEGQKLKVTVDVESVPDGDPSLAGVAS